MASLSGEGSRLLPVSHVVSHNKNNRIGPLAFRCVKSKAVRLVLLWNFAVILVYTAVNDTAVLFQIDNTHGNVAIPMVSFIATCSPLAGLLTDTKLSRYKVVVCTSVAILTLVPLITAFCVVELVPFFDIVFLWKNIIQWIVLTILTVFAVITSIIFVINALQFGMDQLHDSSSEEFILYLHWYVWVYYLSLSITKCNWNLIFYDVRFMNIDCTKIAGIIMFSITQLTLISLIILSLCVVKHRKSWFHIEPARSNPYKLVYRVVRFACLHKVPLQRSAFTYCEDEIPSRIELGKQKYGGPFTTKQVEDVKAFLGVICVLVGIWPAFMLQTVTVSILPFFAQHGSLFFIGDNSTPNHEIFFEGVPWHVFLSSGLLSILLVTISLPLYLCLLRPYIYNFVPRILKRIGLGIAMMITSLVLSLVLDLVVHNANSNLNCMFTIDNSYINSSYASYLADQPLPLYKNPLFFTSQHILTALASMLFDIAVLEFICSQSPYSMKGLQLGIYFSMKHFSPALVMAFIEVLDKTWKVKSLSCGSAYYIIMIIYGILELALFAFVAKRYKYRKVNEPSNEYRYAEDYYSNIQ